MFLGIKMGMVGAICRIQFWNRLFGKETLKSNGRPPPETQLYMGQVDGILVPIGLFAFAFTTYASVPWIIPNSKYSVHPILLRALVVYSELSAFEVSCFTFLMPATCVQYVVFVRNVHGPHNLNHDGLSS
ncbi:hypothetical protein FIBSPDRAFT_76288 [Athelia psychrophila]|uniref:Uncharacterized protein n=1 Tax=Athelia psychrophila TaxID=1759441 RepID=A0A166EFB6_9AGAM|nr:hypothetical protein FIBSPDRAFT_76288 [Fibularhizoctonia sp. CBS 109695]